MKKFGFSKKPAGGDDDPNRSALFGKKGSPAPSDNPYAQSQPANDPYMKGPQQKPSYQQARVANTGGLPGGPSPRGGYGTPPPDRHGSNSSSSPAPPPYSEPHSSGGYGNDRYGSSTGYGSNKYASSGGYGARGAGGYGGLGSANTTDNDTNRDALFSGARDRYDHQQGTASSSGYGQSGADSGASKYGGYGEERELTQEEKEEHDYKDVKRQIYETNAASKDSSDNAVRYMNQAIDTGLSTYARLGAQNERLHHTDQLLDQAVQSNREADARTKKLKTLNRSMFAVHVNNPFTAKRRTAEEEAQVLSQNQEDRAIREATRRDRFAQNSRMEAKFNDIHNAELPSSFSRPNKADRSKYEIEDDSDEEGAANNRDNNEATERNMDALLIGTRKLNMIARGMGQEVEQGNKVIDKIGTKSDHVSDGLHVTRNRLDRIR